MIDFSQLKEKTIVIIGASSGIGRETSKLLGEYGANLVLGARNINELEKLSTETSMESQVLPLYVDVTDEKSVIHFTEEAIQRFGKIDALVNCSGTAYFESALELSTEDFDNMINVNLRGTFLCCKYFGKQMVQQKSGKIINLISIAGTTALPGCGGYSASKFGALGLTKVLQAELRAKGIQVTALLPGSVKTPLWDRIENKPDLSKMIPANVMAEHVVYVLGAPSSAAVDEMTVMPPLGIL